MDDVLDENEFNSPFPVFSVAPDGESKHYKIPTGSLPLIALRNTVLFPSVASPVVIGREATKNLIAQIEQTGELFVCVTQKDAEVEDPSMKDLYSVGTLCELVKVLEMPNGMLTAIIQAITPFRVDKITRKKPFMLCKGDMVAETLPKKDDEEFFVLAQTIKELTVKSMSMLVEDAPAEMIAAIKSNERMLYALNFAAAGMPIKVAVKQDLLETLDLKERGFKLLQLMQQEIRLLELKANIHSKTREEMDRQQKEYFLQQQMRTIQEELGGNINDIEVAELRNRAKTILWPNEEIKNVFHKELDKLERLHPQSPDYSVQMQYVQTVIDLPWGKYSEDIFDLKRAQRILDRDHFGLEQVKERILEHLAVLKLKQDMKSPILCLYGPPGVGKTSLGKSIAESLGRKYIRISLGGLHDEAEIRGHRRTYIGAMCGRIIQGLKKAGTSNPVFILDEIDKISSDFKGDPASALLEVLDPEQNNTFHDNYLDIDYDLSKVLFIATANTLSTVSQPLRDRMELIQVNGYIIEEKMQIAKKYLIPKELEAHGLKKGDISFSPQAIELLIDGYTRESGVRTLQKQIAAVVRKQAKKIAFEEEYNKNITPKEIKSLLKAPIYNRDQWLNFGLPGVVTGLAWTSVGGEILFIESSLHPGKDTKLTLTGNLGDVMKESAVIALDYIKAHADRLNIDPKIIAGNDVHIHVPEGAIPKDGPSAGITMVTSLVSAFTQSKVIPRLAMTGEITLTGRVLPVGGIKEKILAAKRAGVTHIILSKENEKDIREIAPQYVVGLTFHYVSQVEEVLKLALEQPTSKTKETSSEK